MESIEKLNALYLEAKETTSHLIGLHHNLSAIQRETQRAPIHRFKSCMVHLDDLAKKKCYPSLTNIKEAFSLCDTYRKCLGAVEELETALLEYSSGKTNRIPAAQNTLITFQNEFDTVKAEFEQKNELKILSADDLVSIMIHSVSLDMSAFQERLTQIQSTAKDAILWDYKVEMAINDTVKPASNPPTQFLVARYPELKTPYELLRDMGYHDSYQKVICDLRNQGNVLVDASFENANDDAVVAFVIAYIFRLIDLFPSGALNIHIFDTNPCAKYLRLQNCFQSGETGENAKKMIQLHTSMKDLESFRNVTCKDIFSKTSSEKPDLFALYEDDTSDAFNLIILTDGFVGSSGYTATETLETLDYLSKPNETGHRCGIRFLIIDSSLSLKQDANETVKYYSKAIRENCSLHLNYTDGKFYWNEKELETLRIQDDLEQYIQNRGTSIASAVSSIERSYISIEDVSASASEHSNESILYIPVGQSGAESISLPLSCKDENSTVAGQCIGYMAIGQSGSGKSSFFHSIVLNGSLKYSPADLQFWLLDFKYGGASSKYRQSEIPHIRIIAENNKVDDAFCLFQMIEEEIERRNNLFNLINTDNIIDYNRRALDDSSMEYLPRIIIAIDEVQEIFRDDSAVELQKMITAISVRMRSAGMHFIMIAQNLSEGKSYMLKEAFMPSASGRVCFRVAPDMPRDSGFEEEFIQRRQEITELRTGEAYVSYGKGTIKKVKMAYASPEEMSGKYFDMIKSRYPDYSNMKPLIIGSKKRLSIHAKLQHTNSTYFDTMCTAAPGNGIYSVLIGEDSYRMTPMFLQFSPNYNSTVLLLGDDKEIASSICTSIVSSLKKQNVRAYLFNGDKTRVQAGMQSLPHPFMSFCQILPQDFPLLQDYKLNQFSEILKGIYQEYLDRNKLAQESEDEIPMFTPIFLIVNDLLSIDSFVQNEQIQIGEKTEEAQPAFISFGTSGIGGSSQISTQEVIRTLCTNGYRYNIHLVLAIKGSPSALRMSGAISEAGTVILFNKTQFAQEMENSYLIKELLKNISNGTDNETMAVSVSKHSYSKIRPIIYDLSVSEEAKAVATFAGGIQS